MESNQIQSEGLDQDLGLIKVRCPSCFKLYGVDAAEIHQQKPQFECSKCQTRFWFPFPESVGQGELMGFPVEWLQTKVESEVAAQPELVPAQSVPVPQKEKIAEKALAHRFHCPRCEAQYSAGDPECPKCGVVFAKLEMLEGERSVYASPALRRLWHLVMDNYSSEETHQRFLKSAQKEKNLVYASQQYGRLLKAHSGDETALKMQKEIVAMTQAEANMEIRRQGGLSGRKLLPSVTTVSLLAGGVLIGVGFLIPTMRNLIGLGVATVFFTLAVDWLVRKS